MIKKSLLFLMIFVAGCSAFADQYDPYQFVQELGTLIKQENENDKQIKEIANLMNQVQTLAATGDQKKIDKILELTDKEKSLVQTYKKKVESVEKQIAELKNKTSMLDTKQLQQLANQSVQEFENVTKIELTYAQLLSAFFQENEAFFFAVKSGDENAENKTKQIDKQIKETEAKLTKAIQKLNQASQEYQKYVKNNF